MNENNWLGYEVGDDVYVFTSAYGRSAIQGPYKVKKVTATGRITLENGAQFLNRGRLVGGGWSSSYIERKRDQAEKLAAMKEYTREQDLKRTVRHFKEDMSTYVGDKEDRLALAESLEAMAKLLRSFDENA